MASQESPSTPAPADSPVHGARFSPDNRRPTNLSTASSAISFRTLPPGSWDIRFHGSCPRCHHWHNKMTLRLSRLPGVYNGVRCENCAYKWFGLGGNSTHTSLISQQTIPMTLASELSRENSFGLARNGSTGAASLITQMHALSAVGSPLLTTCSVPQRPENDQEDAPSETTRPTSRLRARMSSSPPREPRKLTKKSSSNSRDKREPNQRSDQASPQPGPSHSRDRTPPTVPKDRSLTARLKGKIKGITSRLGRSKSRRRPGCCHSSDTSPSTTLENNRLVPAAARQPQREGDQRSSSQQVQDEEPASSRADEPTGFVPVPPLRRQSAPEPRRSSNGRSDPHGESAYHAPFADRSGQREAGHEEHDRRIQEIRRQKTLDALQRRCECPVDCNCHCKRPSSSLIPDNPLTDRASIYHLDLAQPSETRTRLSQHPEDFAYMGSHLHILQNNSEPGLSVSLSSNGSTRGRSQSRRGREGWRRSIATSTWESQGTTAYSQSADSDAGSSTPRHDLLTITGSSPRARIPSPLASPTNQTGFVTDDEEEPAGRHSISSVDTDFPYSDRVGDGVPSVSPIVETASAGSGGISSMAVSEANVASSERAVSPVQLDHDDTSGLPNHVSDASSGSQLGGPLNSHPVA